ncbi:MAG: YoaK family protein [Acidimicrobiales bacterium]
MVRIDTKVAFTALAIASGSLDVTAFLRLGGVFASIMTSNLVFVSLAAVEHDATLAKHCAAVLLSYIVGVGAGSTLARPSGRDSRLGSPRLSALVTAEAIVLAVCAAWWVAEAARPEGADQLTLLGAIAFAMGLQAAAARSLGDPEAGTTYMTGTLTVMVATAITGRRPDASAVLAIAGILVGAAAGVGLLQTVPDLPPFVAVAGVSFTAGLSWSRQRHKPDGTAAASVPALSLEGRWAAGDGSAQPSSPSIGTN